MLPIFLSYFLQYERQRNVSFAIATIRSLHLDKHVCTLSIQHSLMVPSNENLNDDAVKNCPKEERCSITIDSRVGRIIPKCNFHQGNQTKELVNNNYHIL